MRTAHILALTLAISLTSGAAAGADNTIRTQRVSDNLHVLFGNGGNIAVQTGPDGVFMIDDQYAPMTPNIRKALSELSDDSVRFILNTHWHTDHTGGNENFASQGSIIIAHDNVRERLSSDQFISAFQSKVPASPKLAWPLLSFDQSLTLHLNGDTIRSLHVANAHTDGDSLVHFETANVLHMGDTFFNGMYPFVDLSSGGSVDGVIAAVRKALSLCDDKTVIIPGHGAVTNSAGLRAYLNMLVSLRDAVAQQLKQGQSIDAIVASKPTHAYDKALGGGFISPDAFARTLAESLSTPPQAN